MLDAWRLAGLRSRQQRKQWQARLEGLGADLRGEFERRFAGEMPSSLENAVMAHKRDLAANPPTIATRKASEMALAKINPVVPDTIGGSADLTGSNNTLTKDLLPMRAGDYSGRFIHYGISEHAMAAAMNGMAGHGGVVPYSGTFLVFADYCRPAIRLSALMGHRVIYVMTHDSIGLGEDGPTHQPVEHLAALRAIPNLNVFRPADAMETAECWQLALNEVGRPSILALTRQNVPAVRREFEEENRCARGAYELARAGGDPIATLFATGSEVQIALEVRSHLEAEGFPARVVSVPSFELFFAQSATYQRETIGTAPLKIGIEAAVRQGWDALIGSDGLFFGMTGFGASAPYNDLYRHFGLTAEAITDRVLDQLRTSEAAE